MLKSQLLPLLLACAGFASAALKNGLLPCFDPRSYPQTDVKCPAVDRSVSEHEQLTEINISKLRFRIPFAADHGIADYVEVKPANAKDTILMVHGWPGMWSIWARQIVHFEVRTAFPKIRSLSKVKLQEKGYHILVPNLRGFYKSTHPGDVHSGGTYGDFISDLVCVLDNAGVESAICLGYVVRYVVPASRADWDSLHLDMTGAPRFVSKLPGNDRTGLKSLLGWPFR